MKFIVKRDLMVARDYRNRIIEQGAFVQYVGTKTRGIVDKISTKNSETWIRINSTGLFYRSDYLVLLDPEEQPIKKSKTITIKDKIIHSKNYRKIAPTEISDHTDGPGYGGG
jgi:hypothetical protein